MSEFENERFNFAVLEVFEHFQPALVGIFYIRTDAFLMAQKLAEELPQFAGRSFEVRRITNSVVLNRLSVANQALAHD